MNITNQLSLEHDWLLTLNNIENPDGFYLDVEYYTLILKAYEKKHIDNVKIDDFSGFLEVVYHAMNINSFAIDGILFNQHFKKIPQEEYKQYIRDIKRRKEESSVLKVLRIAQEIFKGLILSYIGRILIVNKDNVIVFQNSLIHTLPSVNVLLHENDSNKYHIWRVYIDSEFELLTKIESIKSFTVKKVETVERHIKKNIPDVDKNNMIGVEMIKTATIERVMIGVRDTLLLNRIFNGINKKFTASILKDIYDYIHHNNKFDYRLIKS